MQRILVTGCAGFIGMHSCERLTKKGYSVFGIDNMNDYYCVSLKKARLENLSSIPNFYFEEVDICDQSSLNLIFKNFQPNKVINLAAQAGVRFSLENPHAYINSNITGFLNILEACKKFNVKGIIYASSSSVYGDNKTLPFSIRQRTDKPISIYAATKKANELMAYAYGSLYNIKTIGLRFFSVYGPWGRPDMAMFKFAEKIKKGKSIDLYNKGVMERDFTYIDDVVDGVVASLNANYSCEIFNIGNNKKEKLLNVVGLIESALNKKAKINLMNIQPGDVVSTNADIEYSTQKLKFNPKIRIEEGIKLFIDWYLDYSR